MIELSPGRYMVETLAELPKLHGCKELFLDAETTMLGRTREKAADGTMKLRKRAVEPHLGDRACGWAITADTLSDSWYVPIRHSSPGAEKRNLDPGRVSEWLQDVLQSAEYWINANVKFDMHFAAADGIDFGNCKTVCTTTLAKTIDSDRFSHGHKDLCRDWLNLEMPEEYEIKRTLQSLGSHDYGRVAPDRMGWYACGDVETNRMLWKYLLARREPEMETLWDTEIALTPVLFDMEREGLRVNQTQCKLESYNAITAMIRASEELSDQTGTVYVDSPSTIHEILCTQLELPVLKYNTNKDGLRTGPSFDKEALALYETHPLVVSAPEKKRVLDLIKEYRSEQHFRSLFSDGFLRKIDASGKLHSSYNQTVRTGRMSCKNPNSQQMSPRAKKLIIPDDGCSFICLDASQLEFRIIVHYINDTDAIAAYQRDAKTDFHQWVADLCEIPRTPAKNINFAKAYGAGKKRIAGMLSGQSIVIDAVIKRVEEELASGWIRPGNRAQRIQQLCFQRAERIYNTYDERLPGIARMKSEAAILCKTRGWIRNKHKRRRHLIPKFSHNAFNSMIQGEAMDLIKERMVAVAPRYNKTVRELGIKMLANVHDELLFQGATEVMRDPETTALLRSVLEAPDVAYRVPILWDGQISDTNWYEAK